MKREIHGYAGGRRGRRPVMAMVLLAGLFPVACAGPTPDDGGGSGAGGSAPRGSGGKSGMSSGSGGSPNLGSGGATGSGGGNSSGSGGASGKGGSQGAGSGGSGAGGMAADAGTGSGGAPGSGGAGMGGAGMGGAGGGEASNFSFFVVSLKALQTLSGKQNGFGGDLRFGKADGLAGADEICRQAAEMGMPGAGGKTWRALLSATKGANGQPVHARDRIGQGPWHDRKGRLLANNLTDLFGGDRPKGDATLVNDMTNERGEPNHYVGLNGFVAGQAIDNHDTLTASDKMGRLAGTATCSDWTSTTGQGPMIGHSWPRSPNSGRNWVSDHSVSNCTPGLDRTLGGTGSTIGSSGGYGGFFCFAQ